MELLQLFDRNTNSALPMVTRDINYCTSCSGSVRLKFTLISRCAMARRGGISGLSPAKYL
jgi:hypothetical protein